jgi:hypothetical protein
MFKKSSLVAKFGSYEKAEKRCLQAQSENKFPHIDELNIPGLSYEILS